MAVDDFAVTWDYRCPFARNAHEHLVAALRSGAPWRVVFVPFSLNQVHVEEGEPDVWDDPEKASGLVAMLAGISVRDRWPDRFLTAHLALFRARHDEGRDIRERDVVASVLAGQGLDADEVFEEVDSGRPLATFRAEHERAALDHDVFGVPTFIAGDQAVFVRLMDRPGEDAGTARRTVERVIDLLVERPELNEFKRTRIPR